ncbi:ATP-binding protein [Kallotenue papyrolyticum]|uniref:ATP-binding protein n=1 Tax=Kallotenue papyrolyticum TaxID=1325125 RepID=UPI0023EDF240|nr:ATP-binding protein [Kallotenue papyrolyticum]
MSIPSDPAFERVVRASAAELGDTFGFDPERIEDLKLAVSEAVNNAIDHGSKRQAHLPVDILFSIHGDLLEVRIIDYGSGVERVDWSRRVVEEERLDAGMLRGFGMYLIRELVDSCEVTSSSNGTTMTLRLHRRPTH